MPTQLTNSPAPTKPVGFALYVGISEEQAQLAGLSLSEIATELKSRLAELVPSLAQETYASLAIAPEKASGRNLDLTRLALREPRAVSQRENPKPEADKAAKGVVVDLKRRRLFVDGRNANLTCKEFELLAFLIENSGKTISREDIAAMSERCGVEKPNLRTIDVHVRRLRSKVAGYEDILRTARGAGYRFDPHPDVLIEDIG